MTNTNHRRQWIKFTTMAMAAWGINPLLANKRDSKFGFDKNPAVFLNSNENAYGPSPLARKAIMEHFTATNRYPDLPVVELKKRIALHLNVKEENILMGAGASEIIGLSCLLAAQTKGNIITAHPSYQVWNEQATAFGLTFKKIPLDKDKKSDLKSMLAAIDNDTRMVYVCNPNNPTGTSCDYDAVDNFVQIASAKTLVLVDEAYTEYARIESLAKYVASNKNLIVAKTFSKIYGLAGARIGYAVAHPETIKSLAHFQPWSDGGVSAISIAAAQAALDDNLFVRDCLQNNRLSRELCYAAFKELSLEYIPSSTNFILFNIDKLKGNFVQQMKEKNIYVQYREHFDGKWCRVSMGTVAEMQQFVAALKAIAR